MHAWLQVYAFWERLANMAKSICEQISERLLRKERVGQFATRFRPDGLSWSVVLQSANSHFVNGWCELHTYVILPLPSRITSTVSGLPMGILYLSNALVSEICASHS